MSDPEIEITEVVDKIGKTGQPYCMIYYRRGISENSITIDGPSSELDFELIKRNILEHNVPVPLAHAYGYYFQNAAPPAVVDECNEVLFQAFILDEDLNPETDVLARFDDQHVESLKKKYPEHWSIEIVSRHALEKCAVYSLEFYAALILYEIYLGKGGFEAGYLAAEFRAKLRHEQLFQQGQKSRDAQNIATAEAKSRADQFRPERKVLLKKLYHNVCLDDPECKRNDSHAARKMLEMACEIKHSPGGGGSSGVQLRQGHRQIRHPELDYLTKISTGKFINESTVRQGIAELRKAGELISP